MEDIVLHVVSNIGVPAGICFYTLIFINKSMQKLTDAINKLGDKVDKIDILEREIRDLKFRVEHILHNS